MNIRILGNGILISIYLTYYLILLLFFLVFAGFVIAQLVLCGATEWIVIGIELYLYSTINFFSLIFLKLCNKFLTHCSSQSRKQKKRLEFGIHY